MSGGYDDGYSKCPCFWGSEPGSLIKIIEQEVDCFSGLEVLDAGCGEGKNAAYLSRYGANVIAMDVSELAIQNAVSAWGALERVEWVRADVRGTEYPAKSFDIVIAYGLLHCMESEAEVLSVTSSMQAWTKKGGMNVICAFNGRRQELSAAHPGFEPALLAHDKYLSLYRGWEIIYATDEDLYESHPHNEVPHVHSMTRMICKRSV